MGFNLAFKGLKKGEKYDKHRKIQKNNILLLSQCLTRLYNISPPHILAAYSLSGGHAVAVG